MLIRACNIQVRYARSESGFTLLELILVMIVTGILSSTLVLPFLAGLKQAARPEIYATAVYLAQKRMEELRSQGYTTASGSLGTTTSTVTKKGRTYTEQVVTGYVTHSSGSFSDPPVSSPSSEFIKVKVTVSNSNISDVSLWTILVEDFYDPNNDLL